MTVITADAGLRALLGPLTDEVEIRDANGTLLGYFTPPALARRRRHEQARALFDMAEAERVDAAERSGAPLEEVMRRLLSLGPKG